MKLSLQAAQRRYNSLRSLLQVHRLRPVAACALAIMLALTIQGSIVRADGAVPPSSVHIYLYTTSGSTTDVTSTYSFHDNHLFDPDGFMIGTGSSNGQILNASATVIGYLATASP